MQEDNYLIVYENLPYAVKGFTLHNAADDYYTIVLNSRMSKSSINETFIHELSHIKNNDFEIGKDVGLIENSAH